MNNIMGAKLLFNFDSFICNFHLGNFNILGTFSAKFAVQ